MRQFFAIVGAVVVALAIVVGLVYGYLYLYKDVAPKFEDARRDVFVNTQSYVEGKISLLTKIRLEYQQTKEQDEKNALRQYMLSEAASVDNSKLPADLQTFLRDLQNAEVVQ